MPRILTRLQIREVSSVDRGAGEGVKIVLMKRDDDTPSHGSRLRQIFRKLDTRGFRPNRDESIDVDDTDIDNSDVTALNPAIEQMVAALQAAVPSVSREQAVHFLLHTAHGRALAQHLSTVSKKEDQSMGPLEAIHGVAKRQGGIGIIADSIIAKGTAPLSEHEFSELVLTAARATKRANESDAQAFSRLFETDQNVRKAYAICKGLVEVRPITVETGATNVESDAERAYEALMELATELRSSAPYLSIDQAFSKVFQDQTNAELAARSLRRRRVA